MSSALVVGSPRNPRHRGLTRLDILLATGRVEMGGDADDGSCYDIEDEHDDPHGCLAADGAYLGPMSDDAFEDEAWFYEPETYDYDSLFVPEPHGEPFLDTKPMFGLEEE